MKQFCSDFHGSVSDGSVSCWFLGIEGRVLSSPAFRVWWGRSLARSCKTWTEERRRWWDWVWWNHSGHSWGSHSPPETARWKISPLINYRNGELINQQAIWESLQRPSQMFNTVKWIYDKVLTGHSNGFGYREFRLHMEELKLVTAGSRRILGCQWDSCSLFYRFWRHIGEDRAAAS